MTRSATTETSAARNGDMVVFAVNGVALASWMSRVPDVKQARSGQRTGRFSEHRGFILAEMQSLARQHPGATW